MPDHAATELPRIVFVYGDAPLAAHVREAMTGQVEIAYAASAREFDAARMTDARAVAALVNLDGDGDWLDAIEARLEDTGVAVVYNDPEISGRLEGWERARWLRHLVAKLSGSGNVDPPRPEVVEPQAVPATVEGIPATTQPEVSVVPTDGTVVERPLSPEEIETMTVDFVAEQGSASATSTSTQRALAEDVPAVNLEDEDAVDVDSVAGSAGPSATRADPSGPLPAPAVASAEDDLPVATPDADSNSNATGAPDVDTETLSAMIDARLAEPELQSSPDSTEVWRVVSGGTASPVQPEALVDTDSTTPDLATNTEPVAASAVSPATAVQDDADVFASLPSLDEWQLLDPDTPEAPAAAERTASEPVLPDSFAGIELVPMETVVAIQAHADPIERWMGGGKPVKSGNAPAKTLRAAGVGGGKP